MHRPKERVRSLISVMLEADGKPIGSVDLGSSHSGLGVSSMDVISFARVVRNEFGVSFTPQDFGDLESLGQLIEFLELA